MNRPDFATDVRVIPSVIEGPEPSGSVRLNLLAIKPGSREPLVEVDPADGSDPLAITYDELVAIVARFRDSR